MPADTKLACKADPKNFAPIQRVMHGNFGYPGGVTVEPIIGKASQAYREFTRYPIYSINQSHLI